MRRKQPVTPQRRSEPRESAGSGQGTAGFSPFAATSERPAPGFSSPRAGATGSADGAESPDERPTGGSRYEFLSFRNWRVPVRLVAIMLIPVIIGLVFGGLRVNTSFDSYVRADRSEKAAKLARSATLLADALENERDLSLIPLMSGQDPQGTVARLRAASDQALATYTNAYAQIPDDAELIRRHFSVEQALSALPHLRANAYKPELLASATPAAYSTLIDPLLTFDNSVGTGSALGVARARGIYAVSLAKTAASTQRSTMYALMVGITTGRNTKYENTELIQDLLVSGKLEQVSLGEFQNGTDPGDGKIFADAQVAQSEVDARSTVKMPDGHTLPTVPLMMNLGLAYTEAAQAGQSNGAQAAQDAQNSAQNTGLTPANWAAATDSHMAPLRSTEAVLLDSVVADSTAAKDSAQTDAILNSAIVIGALALAGLLTGFIARSMILGMRTLNIAALEIANHRLPDLVEKLSKTDPDRVDTNVEPIPLHGKDEIGEVARAFDQVHRQAVSLAAEQALLRGNLNAIFSNLSRRSQGLIQRQLALITDLENNEGDPDQLENLFKLDHLATRMRRNGENLLVLAGEEPGRHWNTPVPLVDVLRAAASEVEQYERIELSGIPETEVIGAAVTDLVHLLAELLENATSFSSPQTRVNVNATRLPDGRVLVEIHDKGIGLTAEDFAEINEKLAEPPTVDASISRRMGLFVVGRLSDRHGIRVQLRPSGESAGTTSLVMLPAHLTQLRHAPEPEEEFTVSRIFGEQQPGNDWQQDPYGARSAAELGFDDNLSAAQSAPGGFSPALDAMQRSLRLDQRRRAALEAGPGDQLEHGDEPDFVEAEFVEAEEHPQQQYGEQQYDDGQGYGQDQGYYGDQPYADQGQGYYADQPYADQGYQQQGYGQGQGYQSYDNGQYDNGPYAPVQQQQERYESFQPSGHPYPAEAPALPAADRGGFDPGLPQRRPGQQLGGGSGLGARTIGTPEAGEQPNWFTGARDVSAGPSAPASRGHVVSGLGSSGPTGPTGLGAWQSENDQDWQRAEQLREPASGGVTPSGLPRRVPKQNLVAGNAKPAAQEGPQVSRNPEEVRGRLTNLRRGVEQGRSASADPNGTTGSFRIDPDQGRRSGQGQNSSTDLFGGSNHQER